MALTSKLIYSNLHGSQRPAYRENLTEIWHVEGWNPASDSINEVYTAPGLPVRQISIVDNNQPSGFRILHVLNREFRSLDPVDIWECTITYCEHPMLIPLTVNRYVTHKPYPVWGDNSGKVPRNVVGDIFLPPLMRTRTLTRIEVNCRISRMTRQLLDFGDYADHKNSANVSINWEDGDDKSQQLHFDTGTLFLDDIRETTVEQPFTHCQLTLLFLQDKKQARLDGVVNGTSDAYTRNTVIGWKSEVPNAGPQFKDGGGVLHAFQDDVGVCMNGIGLLKTDGSRCGATDIPSGILVDEIPDADLQALIDIIQDAHQWDDEI
jgi:hypothetical protein